MITVIIAGGSGTRLWPLSTPEKPKQLLALSSDRTLVQQAYDRATTIGGDIYVVTETSHSDALREQLPELSADHLLIEPGRRGTAHCIIFALDYMRRHHDTEEPVAFIHSDHHVRDTQGFSRSFGVASQVSQTNHEIVLIGVEPTFPSTALGYIERDGIIDDSAGVYSVRSFREKPDYDTALRYVESGNYLWNCGYFVGSVNTFVDEMRRNAPDLMRDFDTLAGHDEFASDDYNAAYLGFDTQVIDVALIEKSHELAVVSASFDWMDIGNFKDLHDVVKKDEANNYFHGENIHAIDVENAYVRNEEPDKPVAVIGLDNIVVVNTANGILVARKDVSAKSGDIAKQLQQS